MILESEGATDAVKSSNLISSSSCNNSATAAATAAAATIGGCDTVTMADNSCLTDTKRKMMLQASILEKDSNENTTVSSETNTDCNSNRMIVDPGHHNKTKTFTGRNNTTSSLTEENFCQSFSDNNYRTTVDSDHHYPYPYGFDFNSADRPPSFLNNSRLSRFIVADSYNSKQPASERHWNEFSIALGGQTGVELRSRSNVVRSKEGSWRVKYNFDIKNNGNVKSGESQFYKFRVTWL